MGLTEAARGILVLPPALDKDSLGSPLGQRTTQAIRQLVVLTANVHVLHLFLKEWLPLSCGISKAPMVLTQHRGLHISVDSWVLLTWEQGKQDILCATQMLKA